MNPLLRCHQWMQTIRAPTLTVRRTRTTVGAPKHAEMTIIAPICEKIFNNLILAEIVIVSQAEKIIIEKIILES